MPNPSNYRQSAYTLQILKKFAFWSNQPEFDWPIPMTTNSPSARRESARFPIELRLIFVIKFRNANQRECERVGHLKIGSDIRNLASANPQIRYRDPARGVREIKVKRRGKAQPIRLATNAWFKATQLGNSYWLCVFWDPLENQDAEPLKIQNPAQKPDRVEKEILATRFFEIPADAIMKYGQE